MPTDFITHELYLFAASTCTTKSTLFGVPSWYQYLQLKPGPNGTCDIVNFTLVSPTGPSSVLLIALALLNMALHLVGLVAIAFVIYGGIQLIISRGEPDKAAGARSTIINSLVGLAIALIAIPFVAYLGNKLG